MEFHVEQLQKHCRVCGKRLGKAKGRAVTYKSTSFIPELLASFGIDVSGDKAHVHPLEFCNPCYVTMKRAVKKGT